MSLGINEIKSCRRVTLKGLYGDQELLKSFILSFKKRVNEALSGI
jgi:ABC-type sulfate transport system permease component